MFTPTVLYPPASALTHEEADRLQLGNENFPMRVRQFAFVVVAMYSLVNQNVQSSVGSTASIA